MDADFLSRMNDAFLAGAKVTKGAMRVKNPQDGRFAAAMGSILPALTSFSAGHA